MRGKGTTATNTPLRFSDLAEVNPRTFVSVSDDALVSFIPMAAVNETGRWVDRQTRSVAEVKTGYTVFQEGDVLFAKITPCAENGKGCHATGLVNGVGFGSTEFHVLRARPGVNPRIVFHLAQDRRVRARAAAVMGGSAGQQRVPADFFGMFYLPPDVLADQDRKASLFDAVDAAIDATRAVIAQTRRIKTALLNDLLTCGVPGRHAQYTESHRLGRIPAQWRVLPLREMAEIQQGIALGPHRNSDKHPTPYLRVANVQMGYLDLPEIKEIEVAPEERKRYALEVGDVLMVEGHANIVDLGRAALVTPAAAGMVCQNHLFRIRTDRTQLDPRFLAFWINSPPGRGYFRMFGGTTSGLNTVGAGDIGGLRLPTPPVEEQEAICRLVDSVDERISQDTELLTRLQEVKSALSQALLTGLYGCSTTVETQT